MTSSADFQLKLGGDIARSAREQAAAVDAVVLSLTNLKRVGLEQSRADREVAKAATDAARARRDALKGDLVAAQIKIQEARLADISARREQRATASSRRSAAESTKASQDSERASRASERQAQREARARQQAVNQRAASAQALGRQRAREEQAEARAMNRREALEKRSFDKVERERKKALKKREAEEKKVNGQRADADSNTNSLLAGGAAIAATAVLAIGAAVVTVTGKVVELGASFALATAEAFDFAEKGRIALTRLTGSSAKGTAAFDRMRAESERLGLDVEETQGKLVQLMGADFSLAASEAIIKVGADLDATGGSAAVFAEVLERMKDSVGGPTLRDLRALQKAGIAPRTMFEELAKATGKSEKELKKLLATGKISKDVGIAAALKAGGRETGSKNPGDVAAERASKTFEGMKNKIKAAWKNTLINIGNQLGPAVMPIMGKLADAAMNLLKSPAIQAAGARLAGSLQRFGGWVETHMPQIEKVASGAIDVIVGSVDALSAAFDFFTEDSAERDAAFVAIEVSAGLIALSLATVVVAIALIAAAFLLVPATIALVTYGISQMVRSGKKQIRDLIVTVVDLIETLNTSKFVLHAAGRQTHADKLRERFAAVEAEEKTRDQKAGGSKPGALDAARGFVQAAVPQLGGGPANDNARGLLSGVTRPAVPARTAAVTPSRSVQSLGPTEVKNNVNAPITVTVQTSSDDPQAVGNETGKGVQKGLLGTFQRLAS